MHRIRLVALQSRSQELSWIPLRVGHRHREVTLTPDATLRILPDPRLSIFVKNGLIGHVPA